MGYHVDSVRHSCVSLCDAAIHCNAGSISDNCRPFTFVLLTIISLGCLIAFIMGAAGSFAISKTGIFCLGLASSLTLGMLMLDCLRWLRCH